MNSEIRIKLLKFARSFAEKLNDYIKVDFGEDFEFYDYKVDHGYNRVILFLYSRFLKNNPEMSNSPENEVSIRILVNKFIEDNDLKEYMSCFNGNELGTIKIMLKEQTMKKLFT